MFYGKKRSKKSARKGAKTSNVNGSQSGKTPIPAFEGAPRHQNRKMAGGMNPQSGHGVGKQNTKNAGKTYASGKGFPAQSRPDLKLASKNSATKPVARRKTRRPLTIESVRKGVRRSMGYNA